LFSPSRKQHNNKKSSSTDLLERLNFEQSFFKTVFLRTFLQNFIKNNLCKVSRRRARDRDSNKTSLETRLETEQWRTQKIFMGGFIQWHIIFICI